MKTLYIIQAYHRYSNMDAAKAKKDWDEGKDFGIINGPYCSIRDVELMKKDGFTKVECMSRNSIKMFEVIL